MLHNLQGCAQQQHSLLLEQQQPQQGELRRQLATPVVVAWVAYCHVGLPT
jgi:hypothetical protein